MAETLQTRLDEQRRVSAEKRPPEVTTTIGRAIEGLRESGIADRALRVGDRAPDFTLPSVHGEQVALSDLLARGPVALAFYRGGW